MRTRIPTEMRSYTACLAPPLCTCCRHASLVIPAHQARTTGTVANRAICILFHTGSPKPYEASQDWFLIDYPAHRTLLRQHPTSTRLTPGQPWPRVPPGSPLHSLDLILPSRAPADFSSYGCPLAHLPCPPRHARPGEGPHSQPLGLSPDTPRALRGLILPDIGWTDSAPRHTWL